MDALTGQPVLEAPKRKRMTFGYRICAECGVRFLATHHSKWFCTDAHKVMFNDRERVRGRVLTNLVQAWRAGRNTKNPAKRAAARFAFQQMAALADRYNREDLEAGRPSALDKASRTLASGHLPAVDNGD